MPTSPWHSILNQPVQGSSPCAPTIEDPEIIEELGLARESSRLRMDCCGPIADPPGRNRVLSAMRSGSMRGWNPNLTWIGGGLLRHTGGERSMAEGELP